MLIFWLACALPEPPKQFEPFGFITKDMLQQHVTELASDAYEGRGTLEAGFDKAADYIAAEFVRIGLQPWQAENTNFRQPYTMYQKGWSSESSLTFEQGTEVKALSPQDWRIFNFSDGGELRESVVFAGYGITAPEYDWDDYDGLDVTGKVVLVFRREPDNDNPESVFEGTESTSYASFRSKAKTAAKNGAKGMILVNDPASDDGSPDFRMPLGLSFDEEVEIEEPVDDPFLAVHVSLKEVDALMGGVLVEAQQALDAGERPSQISLPTYDIQMNLNRRSKAERVELYNVVGYLPATVPNDTKDMVIVGAHLDHLGVYSGTGDTIFNGADDNASGTAGMLTIAEAYAHKPIRTRDMLFVAFSAEEQGLLGSKAFVKQNDVSRVQMMLNLDMIGRNSEASVSIIGDGYAAGLTEAINLANTIVELDISLSGDDYFGASDHNSFYKEHRPFLFFFTGLHDDYHQVSDHEDKLDYAQMEKIARLGYGTVEPVVEGRYTPQFIHHLNWLGVKMEIQDGRLIVTSVNPDSRASEAGIAINSQILRVDEADEPDEMRALLSDVEPESSLRIELQHAGIPQTVKVTRLKMGYLGIYPRDVSEERRKALVLSDDEGVLVQSVGEEGPAAKAGLQADDVILEINSQPVKPRTLNASLSRIGAGQEASLLIIRGEDRQQILVVLGERPKR